MNIGSTLNLLLQTRLQGHSTPVPRESIAHQKEQNPAKQVPLTADSAPATNEQNNKTAQDKLNAEATSKSTGQSKFSSAKNLDEEALRELEKLKKRDKEVRSHEAAHMAAAGQYAQGGISYTYKKGPDGASYAVGGEVSIDTSAVPNDPQATLIKASRIKAAALAPAEPSSQDKSVAAEATQMAAQARQQIAKEHIDASHEKSTKESDNKTEEAKDAAKSVESKSEATSLEGRSTAAQAYSTIENISQTQTHPKGLLDQIA